MRAYNIVISAFQEAATVLSRRFTLQERNAVVHAARRHRFSVRGKCNQWPPNEYPLNVSISVRSRVCSRVSQCNPDSLISVCRHQEKMKLS